MKQPKNYKETKASGAYTPISLGGHHLIIKKVAEVDKNGKVYKTKNGDPYIIVYFDMADNDTQPKYGSVEFQNDVRPDKKWPHSCTSYITTEKEGKCTKQFKTFTTCYAHSNGLDEDAIVWGDGFCDQFTNKKIGGVFGEKENLYQGKRSMRHELRWWCSDDKVDSATIPDPVRLEGAAGPIIDNDGFMDIPAGGPESSPWG